MLIGWPDFYWGRLGADQEAAQLMLKREYDEWIELLGHLLAAAPQAVEQKLARADQRMRTWIELGRNFSLSNDLASNSNAVDKAASELLELVAILESFASNEVIIVPDTNCLVDHPDPVSYRSLVSTPSFTFLLLPTVLAELDDLKVNHRNLDVREAAKRAIRRIKGWRSQGSLKTGVTVDGNIRVRAAHTEPDMRASLSWLDASVRDDRIIAGVLALERSEPGSAVLLATGDINMQNKADAAAISVVDFPDP